MADWAVEGFFFSFFLFLNFFIYFLFVIFIFFCHNCKCSYSRLEIDVPGRISPSMLEVD